MRYEVKTEKYQFLYDLSLFDNAAMLDHAILRQYEVDCVFAFQSKLIFDQNT
jgi:hypothetical protein